MILAKLLNACRLDIIRLFFLISPLPGSQTLTISKVPHQSLPRRLPRTPICPSPGSSAKTSACTGTSSRGPGSTWQPCSSRSAQPLQYSRCVRQKRRQNGPWTILFFQLDSINSLQARKGGRMGTEKSCRILVCFQWVYSINLLHNLQAIGY